MVMSSQELLLEFREYGFHVRVSWLEACLADQRRRSGRVGDGSAGRLRDSVFEQLLWSDLRGYSTGEGLLASNLTSTFSVLKGPLVLQLEKVLNIGVHMEDAATTRGMLKCLFSYGAQNTVAGFEYSRVFILGLDTPRGTKVLVENCRVERGMLLLTNTNTKVIGGGLSGDTQAAAGATPAATPAATIAASAASSVDISGSNSRNVPTQPPAAPQLPSRPRIQLAHEGQQDSVLPGNRSGTPGASNGSNLYTSGSAHNNSSSTTAPRGPFGAATALSNTDEAAARARDLAEEEEDPSKEMYDDFYDPTEDDFSPPSAVAARQPPQYPPPNNNSHRASAVAPLVPVIQPPPPATAPIRGASPPFVTALRLAGADSVDSLGHPTSQNLPSSSSQPSVYSSSSNSNSSSSSSSSRNTFSAVHGDPLLSAQKSQGGDDSQPSPVQRLTFVSPNSARTTASASNLTASPDDATCVAAPISEAAAEATFRAGQGVVSTSPLHQARRDERPCPALPWGKLSDFPLQPPPPSQGAQPRVEQWRVKGCCSDVQSFKLKKRNVALRIYVEDGTAPKRVCLLAEPLVLKVLSWPGTVKELAALKKENKAEFSAVLNRGAAALRCLEGILTIGKIINTAIA